MLLLRMCGYSGCDIHEQHVDIVGDPPVSARRQVWARAELDRSGAITGNLYRGGDRLRRPVGVEGQLRGVAVVPPLCGTNQA